MNRSGESCVFVCRGIRLLTCTNHFRSVCLTARRSSSTRACQLTLRCRQTVPDCICRPPHLLSCFLLSALPLFLEDTCPIYSWLLASLSTYYSPFHHSPQEYLSLFSLRDHYTRLHTHLVILILVYLAHSHCLYYHTTATMATGVMEHKAVLAFLTAFILFSALIIRRLVLRVVYARQAKARGCASPQNLAPIKEPFLGLDFLWETLRAAKEGRYLPFIWERFQKCGNTFVTRRLLYETVHTIDPDNLKHILSTDFHSFRLSDVRVKAMGPLFGNGIFTTEGE